MKRLLIIGLAFVLAGCGAVAPSPAETSTPVVQTVVVTVIPTQAPTEAPTATPAPTQTPQIIVVTATGPSAAAPLAQPTTAGSTQVSTSGSATATLPANAGGDLFTNLTRSSDHFALKCLPEDITFGVSTSNPYVVEVDIYYRIEDRLSTSISEWKNGGKMNTDKNGNFTVDFSAATVNADLRTHKGWFDYQFIGVSKTGDAVGRSAKIVQQITYAIDCSD